MPRIGALLAVALCCGVNAASASPVSPLLSLASPEAFQAALGSGELRPVGAWDSILESALPGRSASFSVPMLSVNESGLVVEFGDIGGDYDSLTAFDFVYPIDPDLSGLDILKEKEFPAIPAGQWGLVIVLIDDTGRSRGWEFKFDGNAGKKSVRVSADGGKQGADDYFDLDDFDISKVVAIRQVPFIVLDAGPQPPMIDRFKLVETKFSVVAPVPIMPSFVFMLTAVGSLLFGRSLFRNLGQSVCLAVSRECNSFQGDNRAAQRGFAPVT